MYQAALDWIHNNGKQVASVKLSDLNKTRRTSNLLSSALRWGTTEHLTVSPAQRLPYWKDGDHELNIGALAVREIEHVLTTIPDAKNWTVDITGHFFDGDGSELAGERLRQLLSDPRGDGIGVSTLLRGVFSKALSEGREGGQNGVVAADFPTMAGKRFRESSGKDAIHLFTGSAASDGRPRLGDLEKILYSQKEAAPSNPEADKIGEVFAPVLKAAGEALEKAHAEAEVLYSQASQADEIAKALKAGTTGAKALELVSTAAGRKLTVAENRNLQTQILNAEKRLCRMYWVYRSSWVRPLLLKGFVFLRASA